MKVNSIVLKMEDGSEKEVERAVIMTFRDDDGIDLELINGSRMDLMRAGIGIISTIYDLGLAEEFAIISAMSNVVVRTDRPKQGETNDQ